MAVSAIKFTFHLALLVVLGMLIGANGINNGNGVKEALFPLPLVLSSCLSPLSPSTTTRWAKELIQEKKAWNVSTICSEGGLICNESIETPSMELYQFSTYRLCEVENNLQYENMFFHETFLSQGSLIKIPLQKPQIPTRAFVPPLIEPHLFNHSTSPFLQVLQAFDFHINTPLADSMQQTLQICNTPPTRGETKACVATFEDMVDFATASIGTSDIIVLASDTLPHDQIVTVMDLYDVTLAGEHVALACHNAMFPFQVFYCHYIQGSKLFKVTLQTTIGKITNISALASCHPLDNYPKQSPCSRKDAQRKELLCHWNYGDNIVWIPTISLSSSLSSYTKESGSTFVKSPHTTTM